MTIETMDLNQVRSVMKRTEGLDLSGIKDQQLTRRITSFCQRQRIETVSDLVAQLGRDQEMRAVFVDRLTINVTNLYRNAERWKYLESDVLPLLGSRPTIWSAGCSNGAEAYSLAIAAVRIGADPTVLGSDIDLRSLEHARRGRYSTEDMREVPSDIRSEYFTEVEGGYQVDPGIARKVRFEQRDLIHGSLPPKSFDLVVCRNVVIYFHEEAKDLVHSRLVERLRAGGVLFVGNAERVNHPADLDLRTLGPQFYRKAE